MKFQFTSNRILMCFHWYESPAEFITSFNRKMALQLAYKKMYKKIFADAYVFTRYTFQSFVKVRTLPPVPVGTSHL